MTKRNVNRHKPLNVDDSVLKDVASKGFQGSPPVADSPVQAAKGFKSAEFDEIPTNKKLEVAEKSGEYLVRVTAKMLKYFSGPGLDNEVLGLAKQNAEFIIVEESGDWGKIKSKKDSWLPLEYCERIKK